LARQKLGQHFLRARHILERIAAAACPQPVPLCIEIGPGEGALTKHLLPRAGRLVAIELDGSLAARLQARFSGASALTVVAADALEVDLSQWGQAVIAGNLPYYAATALIERALAAGPIRAVFLVQKEVAARLAARPGSRDYGYLSVSIQCVAEVEILCRVPPGAFSPPPKVDSAVIRLTPRDRWRELGIADSAAFLRFARACFRQKRKTLRNNLAGLYPRPLLDRLPEMARRAEQLSIEDFARLYSIFGTISSGGSAHADTGTS